MKHTPGPWIASPASDKPFAAWHVVATSQINGYICTTSGNAKADAILIASAPAMKKLIEDIYDGLHRGVGPLASVCDAEVSEWINDQMCNAIGNDWRTA